MKALEQLTPERAAELRAFRASIARASADPDLADLIDVHRLNGAISSIEALLLFNLKGTRQ